MKTENFLYALYFFLLLLAFFCYLLSKLGFMLTYQVTPSMPKGFYLIIPAKTFSYKSIVVFHPPDAALKFLLQHHWIPSSGLLMKYVMAIPKDFVCKKNHLIWINNKKTVPVFHYFAPGKPLPNTAFCHRLGKNQYLLLSNKISHSFDGRYFGPVTKPQIIGKGIKL
jgi:type IV secretory pathway protease TraF